MQTLAIPQLIGLAQDAGFSGPDLSTAVAVALAESGGDPTAYNPEVAAGAPVGYGSFGLWQIYLKAHPEFQGKNLMDPTVNAMAAYSVYVGAGNSFRPWSTFKSGTYLAFMDPVNQALGDQTAAADGSIPGGTDGTTVGILALAGAIAVWLAFKVLG